MRRPEPGLFIAALLALASPAMAALELSTDQRPLVFGMMQLGDSKELTQLGTYHNEVTCLSTNGRQWYLKINVLQPLSSGIETIPFDRFQWQLAWTDGTGTIPNPYHYAPFQLMPELVYVSGSNEAEGRPVRLQFKYALTIPDEQVSGAYQTTIRFTLTEIL